MSRELNTQKIYKHLSELTGVVVENTPSEFQTLDNILDEVQTTEIKTVVFRAISGARQQIYTTMFLSEERERPLPRTYHKKLKQKTTEGVRIIRVGFGSIKDFDFMAKKVGMDSKNFTFIWHSDITAYQRFV